MADLEAALETQERAVAEAPRGSEDWPGHLSSLGNRYLARYDFTGDAADLDAAIEHHERAGEGTPAGSADLPAHLANWANSLRARYDRTGDPTISHRQVLAQVPAQSPRPCTATRPRR